jgi:hypothetical protein
VLIGAHNYDEIKGIAEFNDYLWLKNIIELMIFFWKKLPITRLGAAFQKKSLKFISSCIHAHVHMEKFWQFTENMIKKNNLQNAKLPMKFF